MQLVKNRHNFEVLLEQAHQTGEIRGGRMYLIDVSHDDDCSIFNDEFCDCDCLIRIEDITDMTSRYVN